MSSLISTPLTASIVAVNTATLSKTVLLPPPTSVPGRLLIIKDSYGACSSNNILISTTIFGNFIERSSTNRINLSSTYGAFILTNDGINTWFLLDIYSNSLSTQSVNKIYPFGFAASITYVGTTLATSWTQSDGAISYTVSYYYTNTNASSGGTLIQTVANINSLFSSIYVTPTLFYYYYATVTSINAGGSYTITTTTTSSIILPVAPINVNLLKAGNYLYCYWVAQAYTLSYNIIFYQTSTQTTIGGTIFQAFSGITTPYYQSSIVVTSGQYYYASVVAVNTSGISSTVQTSSIAG